MTGKTELVGGALERSWAGRLLRRLPTWRGAIVLTYHRIARSREDVLDRGVWSTTPEAFDDQLGWLSRSFDVAGPEQLDASLRGRGRRVLITFDDGYRDNWELARPILHSHGVPATFFLTTGFLDGAAGAWWDEIAWMARAGGWPDARTAEMLERYKRLAPERREPFLDELAPAAGGRRPRETATGDWMTWDQVRELRGAGMAIGAHTVSHPILGGLAEHRQREEIDGSIERLAQELGERPTLFAFPDGRAGSHDDHSLRALRAAGIRFAFKNDGGMVGRRSADPLLLPRVNVWQGMSAQRFRLLLTAPAMAAR